MVDAPVFFDVESSGLAPGSFPIEVGWAFVGGSSESLLVRPHEAWLSRPDAWDPSAEARHGISREHLAREGRPIDEVAHRLNGIFTNRILVSPSPEHHLSWVSMIFEWTTNRPRPTFQVSQVAADMLIAGQLKKHGIGERVFLALRREAERHAPHRHRAAADAFHYATLWQLVS
jgi:DNA polymerase III epsilon subunit-like protein